MKYNHSDFSPFVSMQVKIFLDERKCATIFTHILSSSSGRADIAAAGGDWRKLMKAASEAVGTHGPYYPHTSTYIFTPAEIEEGKDLARRVFEALANTKGAKRFAAQLMAIGGQQA